MSITKVWDEIKDVVCVVALVLLFAVAISLVFSIRQCSVNEDVARKLETAQDEVGRAQEAVATARREATEAEAAHQRLESKLTEVEESLGSLREDYQRLRAESERLEAGIGELEAAIGSSLDGVGELGGSLEEVFRILDATIQFLEQYAPTNSPDSG